MNLAPLYRIQDEGTIKKLERMMDNNGQVMEDLSVIQSWCLQNNWCKKFSRKYHISMENIPKQLAKILKDEAVFEPAERLIQAVESFSNMEVLHRALEEKAFEMLENGWIDLMGTDMHNMLYAQALIDCTHDKKIEKVLSTHTFLNKSITDPTAKQKTL
jgi:hypothetical protein